MCEQYNGAVQKWSEKSFIETLSSIKALWLAHAILTLTLMSFKKSDSQHPVVFWKKSQCWWCRGLLIGGLAVSAVVRHSVFGCCPIACPRPNNYRPIDRSKSIGGVRTLFQPKTCFHSTWGALGETELEVWSDPRSTQKMPFFEP